MQSKVRLTEKEIKIIKDEIKKFDPEAKVILFGSRCDLNKKGGDIDIVVLSEKIDFSKKMKVLTEYYKKLGDRRIDLIITDRNIKSPFIEMAVKTGIEL